MKKAKARVVARVVVGGLAWHEVVMGWAAYGLLAYIIVAKWVG